MARPSWTPLMTVILIGLATLGPVSMVSALPALPSIMAEFGAGPGGVPISMATYMFGLGAGQLPVGPLSDRFGRKPLLLIGLAVFIGSAIAITFTANETTFNTMRFFQGLAASTFFILARSIVRDLVDRERAAQMFGYVTIAVGATLVSAPFLGSLLLSAFGWHAIFFGLSIYGVVILLLTTILLPETLRAPDMDAIRPSLLVEHFGTVGRDQTFRAYLGVHLGLNTGLHAFISTSAAVFIGFLGQSPTQYAATSAFVFGGVMVGGIFVTRFVKRLGMSRVLFMSVTLAAAAGIALIAVSLIGKITVLTLAIPIAFFMLAVALGAANTQAGAMSPFPHMAGTASTTFGFIQQIYGAIIGAILGIVATGTHLPMITAIGVGGLVALVVYLVLVRSAPASAPTPAPEDTL